MDTARHHRTYSTAAAASLVLGAGALALAFAWAARPRFSFHRRVVVITGGARGLGLVLARELAREGARLALLARDGDELDRAVDELGDHTAVLGVRCDATRQQDVNAAIAHVLARFGRIDVLINNAGVIQVGPLEHMTVDDFRASIDIHLFAPLFTTLAVLPPMRRQGGGRIVNIASIGGKIPAPHLSPYVAGKFGLVGLSEALAVELRKDGILVTTVSPGLMRTGSPPNAYFKGRHRAEYAWFAISDAAPLLSIDARRAARQILDACRDGRAHLVISWPAKLAIAFHALCPETFARLAALANRLLPASLPGRSPENYPGWMSASRWAPSALTTLSDRATLRNHEV